MSSSAFSQSFKLKGYSHDHDAQYIPYFKASNTRNGRSPSSLRIFLPALTNNPEVVWNLIKQAGRWLNCSSIDAVSMTSGQYKDHPCRPALSWTTYDTQARHFRVPDRIDAPSEWAVPKNALPKDAELKVFPHYHPVRSDCIFPSIAPSNYENTSAPDTLYVTDYTVNPHAKPPQANWCSPELSGYIFKIEMWDLSFIARITLARVSILRQTRCCAPSQIPERSTIHAATSTRYQTFVLTARYSPSPFSVPSPSPSSVPSPVPSPFSSPFSSPSPSPSPFSSFPPPLSFPPSPSHSSPWLSFLHDQCCSSADPPLRVPSFKIDAIDEVDEVDYLFRRDGSRFGFHRIAFHADLRTWRACGKWPVCVKSVQTPPQSLGDMSGYCDTDPISYPRQWLATPAIYINHPPSALQPSLCHVSVGAINDKSD
ncbi:uncharacterized protein HD556DRAFT_1460332 [Suillus plorans]|uniref:Uncharacterized protein n=1 Tax=Suillus plorans TaxID=116603 RepID=A0A9P7DN79_9AGAM|nr:uncharacterized protein HD556DRAFT_1460332 [Suillus plorans]KAG1798916.1 hypothetical protein HD556DRAFT_1460332 [Suillus plorans]